MIKSVHFPVEYIIDQVLNLFSLLIKEKDNQKALNEGLNKSIKYIQKDAPVSQPGSLSGDNTIELYDNYCEFLRLLCYSLLVINDCSLIVNNKGIGNYELSKKKAQEYLYEAYEMFDEALLMLKKHETQPEYMKASRGKIFSFPNTIKNNYYTPYADSMTIAGMVYIMHHEFGHFIYEHDEDTRYNELEADSHAIKLLTDWSKKTNNQNTVAAGIIMALIATAFINPDLTSTIYPDIDERIENVLRFIDEKDKNNHDHLLYRILGFSAYNWGRHFNIDFPPILPTESHLEYLCRIKPIIIEHKKKTKII